ncbi:MAG: DNRLRE domain-containing protein [Verrucomicrobiota bacterium]
MNYLPTPRFSPLRSVARLAVLLALTSFTAVSLPAQVLLPVEDSYISEGSANSNFGSSPVLELKNDTTAFDRKIYLKYDLTGISSGDILSGSVGFFVSNSTGTAAGALGGTREYTLWGMTDVSWTEGSITWNNAPNNDASGSFTSPAELFATQGASGGDSSVTIGFDSVTNDSLLQFLNDNAGGEVSLMFFRTSENASVDRFFSTDAGGGFSAPTLSLTLVPEPASGALLAGALGLLALRRRRA